MDDLLELSVSSRPGYRLQRLEVYNWGTFDSTRGQVYTVQPAGQMALLIGQNGSGKSTTINLLSGEIRPDDGTVTFADRDITSIEPETIPETRVLATIVGGRIVHDGRN